MIDIFQMNPSIQNLINHIKFYQDYYFLAGVIAFAYTIPLTLAGSIQSSAFYIHVITLGGLWLSAGFLIRYRLKRKIKTFKETSSAWETPVHIRNGSRVYYMNILLTVLLMTGLLLIVKKWEYAVPFLVIAVIVRAIWDIYNVRRLLSFLS